MQVACEFVVCKHSLWFYREPAALQTSVALQSDATIIKLMTIKTERPSKINKMQAKSCWLTCERWQSQQQIYKQQQQQQRWKQQQQQHKQQQDQLLGRANNLIEAPATSKWRRLDATRSLPTELLARLKVWTSNLTQQQSNVSKQMSGCFHCVVSLSLSSLSQISSRERKLLVSGPNKQTSNWQIGELTKRQPESKGWARTTETTK